MHIPSIYHFTRYCSYTMLCFSSRLPQSFFKVLHPFFSVVRGIFENFFLLKYEFSKLFCNFWFAGCIERIANVLAIHGIYISFF
jgi:hypothetical protein